MSEPEPEEEVTDVEVVDEEEEWPFPWMAEFLRAIALSPNVAAAARHAGVARQRAFQVRHDPDPRFDAFRAAWREAHEQSIDVIEQFALRMGTTGLEQYEIRTVTVRERNEKGELQVVQEKTIEVEGRLVSPTVTMALLRAYRPELFRESRDVRVSGPDGGPVPVAHEVLRTPTRERIKELLEVARKLELPEGDPPDGS